MVVQSDAIDLILTVPTMNVIFRADASLEIGSGHVMRCVTLAEALRAVGVECQFICRAHPGHLIDNIERKGFKVHVLPSAKTNEGMQFAVAEAIPAHAHWLGVGWEQDARECAGVLSRVQPDWLVVDHYGLNSRWERQLAPWYRKLLVIDDLADRAHLCDLLLDQNLVHSVDDYAELVPDHCEVLSGARYALLRPEFAELRDYSLQRREPPKLKQILISMGGVDQPNATGQVLKALRDCSLPLDCQITVVMGATAPWLKEVKVAAASMPWPTEVVVNISDMAQRMAASDLAIGAAGSTSWERCCLGLPTLMVILAKNQIDAAIALQVAGAALLVGEVTDIEKNLGPMIEASKPSESLKRMSDAASRICKGDGLEWLMKYLSQGND